MSPLLSFGLAQLPLFTQAYLLHPQFHSNQVARLLRLTLIPITFVLLISFASQWRLDHFGPANAFLNVFVGSFIIVSALRACIWGTTSQAYHRLPSNPHHQHPSLLEKLHFAHSILSSPRGIGWSFGTPIKPFIKADSDFLSETLRRLWINLSILISSCLTITLIYNSSYSHTLFARHVMTFFAGTHTWTMLDSAGCLLRLTAFALQLDKSQYPFFLDAPIGATSLADFWSRRWHSLLRYIFVEAGYKPFESLIQAFIGPGPLSRAAGLLGAFFISGLIHEFALWFATYPDYTFRTTIFFTAQGLGVVLESTFSRLTGRKVGCWVGRIWGLLWLVLWGRLMIDAFMEHDIMDKETLRAMASRWIG